LLILLIYLIVNEVPRSSAKSYSGTTSLEPKEKPLTHPATQDKFKFWMVKVWYGEEFEFHVSNKTYEAQL